jgi:hypothetical protein
VLGAQLGQGGGQALQDGGLACTHCSCLVSWACLWPTTIIIDQPAQGHGCHGPWCSSGCGFGPAPLV